MPTYHNDQARTGLNPNETILTPNNVKVGYFGRLFTIPVDGKVDAQPLYASAVAIPGGGVHNLLIVVTEHDSAYAFDADTGSVIWQTSVVKAGETSSDSRQCGEVVPEIGITSTPVIDRTRGPHGAIYLEAASTDGLGNYFQRLHALDLATGAELFNGPQDIAATYPGTGVGSSGGVLTFDPKRYKERASLLLLNGVVYMGWGSHCDTPPYRGWIMGYSADTLAQTAVLNVTPNGTDGSIWMAGGGLAADSSGNMYFLDANGTFDATLDTNGFPVNGDYGNGFLKLSTASGLAVADYFEMDNTVLESKNDLDLGSGGLLLVPDQLDGYGNPVHLAVGAGKDTNLYLVNRDSMGKFLPNDANIYQELVEALPGGIWSSPAYFNNTIYYGPVRQPIMAFKFSNAKLLPSPVAQTPTVFLFPGAAPSISANGTSNGIVWAAETNSLAVLHAYDPTDLHELYNSNQLASGNDHFGRGNKFITPTIANGKVYVGTTTGVGVFGLLTIPPTPTPTITPKPGLFKVPVSVGITDTNAKAKIYYTTDGSTPTPSSTLYTGHFTINGGPTTVNAIAVYLSQTSSVASSTYTFQVAAPQFKPGGARYSSAQSVTISDFTPGSTIYYTTNGTTPTTSSPVYNGPISVTSTTTIQALAVENGYANSVISSARYTIGP